MVNPLDVLLGMGGGGQRNLGVSDRGSDKNWKEDIN